MASTTSGRGNTPPYVPYPSFKTLLSDLHEHGIPSRIDRSVLKRFSGITGTQLMTAFRFLKLIDEDNSPTPKLSVIVDAFGSQEWGPKMIDLLQEAYAPLFGLDLGNATASHFDETFRKSFPGADSVVQKCVAFFLGAAKDSGIVISDRVLLGRKMRPANGSAVRKPRQNKRSARAAEKHPKEDDEVLDNDKPVQNFQMQLLAKFPEFDPEWTDEVQAKWFEGYQRLLAMGEAKSGKSGE